MSTPTPGSASKKASGHASTPSHTSPAPRSVPSPAMTRKDQASKTPVNHPTTGSSQGTKTVGGTPMVQQLSRDAPSNPSPSGGSVGANNMLSFGTPAGLGVDLGTPGQLNMPTPAGMSAPAMNLSMSDMGLSLVAAMGNVAATKRNEDEERRTRMRRVLQNIGRSKGRVSEEGVARVARRVGFASDIDGESLTKEERERKVGNRMFSIAGNTVQIDVAMARHVPRSVDVAFSVESEPMKEHGLQAGRVLLDDLTNAHGMSDKSTAAISLGAFAANLDSLARLDRLSSDRINCFEAITGVYSSLSRLYQQQKQALKVALGDKVSEEKLEDGVMTEKSGRPTTNANGKIGTGVEYWRAGPAPPAYSSSDAMDIDGVSVSDAAPASDTFAVRIEVEASFASLFPPIRVTDGWLPADLDFSASNSDVIPWLDPPATYLAPAEGQGEDMAVNNANQQKLPDLRFVGRLDPSIVMPWQTAVNLLSSFGCPQPPLIHAPYHHLLLTPQLPYSSLLDSTSASLTAQSVVLGCNADGEETTSTHIYRLFASRLDYAFTLEDLPFSHPRQIVQALPTLRQWAMVGALLKSAFAVGLQTDSSSLEIPASVLSTTTGTNAQTRNQPALSPAEFDALPDADPAASSGSKKTVDINFATSPVPSFAITFPSTTGTALSKIAFQILPNAKLEVYSQNLVSNDEDGAKAREMARALTISADLGVWVEWLRFRYKS